jgi:hypothetical protein
MRTLREFEPEKHFTTQASRAALFIEAFESGDADFWLIPPPLLARCAVSMFSSTARSGVSRP